MEGPVQSGNQGLGGDGPDVGRVRGAQVVDQKGVDPGRLVPGVQPHEVVPDRVEGPLVRRPQQRRGKEALGEDPVVGLHVEHEVGVVGVPPDGTAIGRPPPGQGLGDLNAARKLVEPDPLKLFVHVENVVQIIECVGKAAVAVGLQIFQPSRVPFLRDLLCCFCVHRRSFLVS